MTNEGPAEKRYLGARIANAPAKLPGQRWAMAKRMMGHPAGWQVPPSSAPGQRFDLEVYSGVLRPALRCCALRCSVLSAYLSQGLKRISELWNAERARSSAVRWEQRVAARCELSAGQ